MIIAIHTIRTLEREYVKGELIQDLSEADEKDLIAKKAAKPFTGVLKKEEVETPVIEQPTKVEAEEDGEPVDDGVLEEDGEQPTEADIFDETSLPTMNASESIVSAKTTRGR